MKLAADEEEYESSLEAELRSKLELTRVIRCGRTAEESAIVGPLAKGINGSIGGCDRRLIKSVEQIENLADQIETKTFAEPDRSG